MKKLNVKTIVFAAVLVAMNLVLSRVLAINYRFQPSELQ